MKRRVLLHVGTPKSGTSLLQHALHVRRDALRGAGLLYPGDRPDAHFLAALDLMGLTWGGLEHEAVGAWERLTREVVAWSGTAVVSHEILGAATPEQARRAVHDLTADGSELHLVVSARDLARQVPAEWQENLKHRRMVTYAEFLDDLRDPERPTAIADWFWRVQDLADLTDRWGSTLAPDRVHVVTVPPAGAPPAALWDRFVEAFGLAGLGVAPEGRPNASLGVVESAVLRRLNRRLNGGGADAAAADAQSAHDSAVGGLPGSHYRPLVRELLVHNNLASAPSSARLTLPGDLAPWCREIAGGWVQTLRARGYRVHGDLEDLVPASRPAAVGPSPDQPDAPDEHAVADRALDSLAVMIQEAARLRDVEADLRRDLAEQRSRIEHLESRWGFRTRRRLVSSAERSALLRWAYAAYRGLRGRSSAAA